MEQLLNVALTILLAQSVLVSADDVACGSGRPRELSGYSGTFQSPNHPNNYPNNANCQWRITAEDPESSVRITFDTFNTESNYDWVNIYDGPTTSSPRILRVSGATQPAPAESTGNVILVEFTTDSSVVRSGFVGRFLAEKACGSNAPRVITDPAGSILSPAFPENYSPGLRCNWTIQAVDQILISFEAFDLEESETEFCRWDFLDIYDGESLVGRYCGPDTPPSFTSSSNEVKVFFRTDLAIERSGFKLDFEPANGITNPPTTPTGAPPTTDSSTSSGTNAPPTGSPPVQTDLYLEMLLAASASTNNEVISSSCAAEYSASMRIPLAFVLAQANAALGDTLCPGVSGLSIPSGQVAALANNFSVGFQIAVYLLPTPAGDFATHHQCSRDIVAFVGDFSNWRDPIVDDIFGCPDITFDSEEFVSAGTSWAC